MVEKAGQQLIDEVMSSSSPAMMKFVKSDHCMLLDKNKIGFLTVSGPIKVEICREKRTEKKRRGDEKRELSTIKEDEVRRGWLGSVHLICNTPGDWSNN